MSRFYVAALTGRSGSGKSYASDYLAARGVPMLDGDDVAREVVQKGERTLRELVKEFGEDILLPDGALNRRRLADICFADPKKQEVLNSITHPAIIRRLTARFDELKEAGKGYCVVEAPALIESGLYAVCDRIIMICAPFETEIERITERDGITREQAEARLNAQADPETVRPLCDVVIDNDGSLIDFDKKLAELKDKLDEWFIQ